MAQRQPGRIVKRNYRSVASTSGFKYTKSVEGSLLRSGEATSQDEKYHATRLANAIDERMGFPRFESGREKVGWLVNMHSTSVEDPRTSSGRAGVDYYFLAEDGSSFKATVEYDPYFLLAVRQGREQEVEEWIKKNFEGIVKATRRIEKEDLSMPNHLLGYRRGFLELKFQNVNDLLAARKVILPIAERNRRQMTAMDAYIEVANSHTEFDIYEDERDNAQRDTILDASNYIADIREYDVPYHVRVAIDKNIRVGKWYTVEAKHGSISLTCLEDRLQRADPVVMAYDIETTKLPLKFPDSSMDQIMMISYMVDGCGFLITNREIVSEDIADFDYTPKAEFPGPFMIFNEPNERAMLERFFLHIKECKPTVIATYNGDFFDWPFVEARASILGIDMYQEIGFRKNSEDVYQSDYCVHMDCFAWVNRDSYLPQGSRGLKAVTVAKLGYDPDELDPELMTPYANEKPQVLAEYSVSDAVATYYLYMKYVHPFIFSLCTIIPLNPGDTLRKGTGTLCETLLMVQAFQKNIVLPNKHKDPPEAFYEGHLLDTETYVGGHVESIEAGVFRSDIDTPFSVEPAAIDELISDLDAALRFTITVEEKRSMDDIVDYDMVKSRIIERFEELKENPHRVEKPLIYHLDVASMYPNIMTTNRLQPDSMIKESDCAACDFNRPGKTCDRRLPWAWRGEYFPAKSNEYNMLRHTLENERITVKDGISLTKAFSDLTVDEQARHIKKRVSDYSKKIYHRLHDTKTVEREAIICQRENPFYVDTVKDFRDRRYDFKGKEKEWKGKTETLRSAGAPTADVEDAKKMVVLFGSLQLAHKVILNSFYGYVMRKASRWYSMEMAGVTCLTGARIIQMARELVERIGRPLELDTDGIWCMLPRSFPEDVKFTLRNGKKLNISYPCTMLNHLVHGRFTNHQYQTLVDPVNFEYSTHSDNTIFFEVDGPYKAMILPTSKEEDKNLKKRYAVFNHDGTLAEIKGFELKRRGELKLIKLFQKQIFKFFLEGTTLAETYEAVARVANKWLDVLEHRGSTLADEELVDLISENKSMTKTVEEYGAQKSTAITTARRLAEFLGEQMIKDKGLNCQYIIAAKPRNAPVTERAIPVAIFSSDESIKRHFLRKWLRDDPGDMDLRTILDWNYYVERLGGVIQKLITIPAALQHIRNPVPRIAHPEWLQRRILRREDRFKQKRMTDMFATRAPLSIVDSNERLPSTSVQLENLAGTRVSGMQPKKAIAQSSQKRKLLESTNNTAEALATLPLHMPDFRTNYSRFIAYQKRKWAIQKEARYRRRQLFGDQSSKASDLGGHFRNQAVLQFTGEWQVLQLRETDVPGVVRAFVLIEKKIHALKILISRVLYLNAKQENVPNIPLEGCKVEPLSTHTLPSGHPSTHLFRLVMPEETFARDEEGVTQLFHHPSIEGIYEKNVPLSIRAVLQLGNICTIDQKQNGVLGRGLEHGFDLSALVKPPDSQPYLSKSHLGYFYLYHIMNRDRQVFALFSTTDDTANVIVLNKSRNEQGLPSLEKLYQDRLASEREAKGYIWQDQIEYQESLKFHTTHVTTLRKAYLALTMAMNRYQKDESRPMLTVIQSSQHRRLLHDLPSWKDMPVLPMNVHGIDREWPSLGWQSFVVKHVINNYLALGTWIDFHLGLARYGDVPLCNLDYDDPRFLIDVAYARRLQQSNVILWWSPGPLPDHSGHENDNILGLFEGCESPSVNVPGTYSSVCVEVSVKNILINTILSSTLINSADEFSVDAANDDSIFSSPTGFASPGFAVLRDMVSAWVSASCQGNRVVDTMVEQVIRWIASPNSFLYDRALHHYVQLLCEKVFQRLTNEFKRVGSHIVHATPTRILLQTTKSQIGNAYAYADYMIKAIRSRPLFEYLDLEVKEYWDYLIWYDSFNYGGRACDEFRDQEEQDVNIVMHWQLATFLPPIYQGQFHEWVTEYIEEMHKIKHPQSHHATDTSRQTQLPMRVLTKSSAFESNTPNPEAVVLLNTIGRRLKKSLINLLARYRLEVYHEELATDHVYPALPGSHLNSSVSANPVLQMTKSLMHVFALDKAIDIPVRALRKELLSLFDVREFANEGRFQNPSAILIIENWNCERCGISNDLDLCRDEALLPGQDLVANDNGGSKVWLCSTCGESYSHLAVQENLVSKVQEMVVRWATQDILCSKCREVRSEASEFMEHCGCSGVWVGTIDRDLFKRDLYAMESAAKLYGMSMLGRLVKEALASF